MKDLLKTLVNSSNLKLLCGNDLGYEFPLKYPKSKDIKQSKIRLMMTLEDIIGSTGHKCVRSSDSRFDGKHPIEIAIERLQSNGFTKETIYKILKNKASVRSKQIKGANRFLANFISDDNRAIIIGKLKEVTISKYGQFLRDGQIF